MAIGDNYATLAELKSRMSIADTNDDPMLTISLATASRGIEKFCRRQFNTAGAASARVYHPIHNRLVVVDDFHTTAGLVVKTDADDDGVYETTWTSADYQLEPLNGVQDGISGWAFWRIRAVEVITFDQLGYRAPVEVTANWGWAAIPAPVKESCLQLAEECFKMKDSPYGVAGMGDFVVRIRDNPKIAGMLTAYRREGARVA